MKLKEMSHLKIWAPVSVVGTAFFFNTISFFNISTNNCYVMCVSVKPLGLIDSPRGLLLLILQLRNSKNWFVR
jgi:hypothetical protein